MSDFCAIQSDINCISNWSSLNAMTFNTNKCKCMRISRRTNPSLAASPLTLKVLGHGHVFEVWILISSDSDIIHDDPDSSSWFWYIIGQQLGAPYTEPADCIQGRSWDTLGVWPCRPPCFAQSRPHGGCIHELRCKLTLMLVIISASGSLARRNTIAIRGQGPA